VIAARCADKCRAFLLEMNGEYNYWPCSLASEWFAFTGITPDHFKDVVRRVRQMRNSPDGSASTPRSRTPPRCLNGTIACAT